MRYDACVIGAGADGLAAAAWLARARLKTIVIEREAKPGGRLAMREFHPGFRAAPFVDEVAPIPPAIFHALELARSGAIMVPAPASVAVWPDRFHLLRRSGSVLLADMARRRAEAIVRAGAEAGRVPPRRTLFGQTPPPPPWPSGDLSETSIDALLRETGAAAPHLMAQALSGRAADPFLIGTALHMLVPAGEGGGAVMGGPGRLADVLAQIARNAGAEISCGLEATDIKRAKGRIACVCLADGSEIETRAVISTLDLRRTFLSLFSWNELPPDLVRRAGDFRFGGGTARVLLALERLPPLAHPEAARGPIHVAPDPETFAEAHAAWRAGTIPPRPPATVRIVSAADPSLALHGAATVTVTFSAIPLRLFDGAWTHEKRDTLRDMALAALEAALPGAAPQVIASDILAPPDFEEALGLTDGDLWGGEIAPDQMFGARPGPRTQIDGLYLAGPSSAAGVLGACVGGVVAAKALLADRAAGRLK